jgi:hypothetical protein
MIEVTHEVGAQDAQFVHAVLHDGTSDLAMNDARSRAFHESLPAARESCRARRAKQPRNACDASYIPSKMVGPTVVPCYVGSYYTTILGNGSVIPCYQYASPVGHLREERRFADIRASPEYAEFRTVARSLPKMSDRLMTCECDNCALGPRNLAIHNFLHPLNPIQVGGKSKGTRRGISCGKCGAITGNRLAKSRSPLKEQNHSQTPLIEAMHDVRSGGALTSASAPARVVRQRERYAAAAWLIPRRRSRCVRAAVRAPDSIEDLGSAGARITQGRVVG